MVAISDSSDLSDVDELSYGSESGLPSSKVNGKITMDEEVIFI